MIFSRHTGALVSVHDVMPETRADVDATLALLAEIPPPQVTLLVVPGRQWDRDSLDWLRALEGKGHVLAGHGWRHRCAPPRSLYHRLHSLLLSRDAAEHLSLGRRELKDLLGANYAWFRAVGLTPPQLYVPPAWAQGALTRADLRALPFRWYETLGGVYDSRTDCFHPLPLAGFEADTRLRAVFLSAFNHFNRMHSRLSGRPLRLGIHPADHRSLLADQLRAYIATVGEARGYDSLVPAA